MAKKVVISVLIILFVVLAWFLEPRFVPDVKENGHNKLDVGLMVLSLTLLQSALWFWV